MTRALAVFTVSLRGRKLRVRLLASEAAVDVECRRYEGGRRAGRFVTRAFFMPPLTSATAGAIVLPGNGPLNELIPHEVVHAVMHRVGGVHCTDDEPLATDVGLVTARIFREIKRRGIEVTP